ncbi:MAG TPA: universal stress protein [Actinomycetota bacterium]|nr:universal stress protein [Actinomycetota bacterium]
MSVVVGYDGSEYSEWAVRKAVEEARSRGLALEVVTVWDQPTVDLGMGSGAVIDPNLSDVVAQRAAAIAAEGAALVAGVDVTATALAGPAAAALVDRGRDAELLVVGSHGRHAVADMLLGGVSRQVATHARCPVMVVRSGVPVNRRIAVGIDGSEQSGRALDFAFEQASRRGASLRVIHSWDVPVIGFDIDSGTYPEGGIIDDVRDAETRLSAQLVAGYAERYPDVAVEVRVIRGQPSRVLVEESQDCDLLVLGSRGRGGFASLLLGSVSHRVLHRAHCDLTIVH